MAEVIFDYSNLSPMEKWYFEKYPLELIALTWRPKVSERSFVKVLMTELKKIPHSWWYKIPDPVRCPKCGIAGLGNKRPFDIVGCVEGRFVALEAKASDKLTASDHQTANLYLVAQAKGYSGVISPENKDLVIAAVRKHSKKTMI